MKSMETRQRQEEEAPVLIVIKEGRGGAGGNGPWSTSRLGFDYEVGNNK